MISIIQNGKEKTYYARCYECGTEMNYGYEDVKLETSVASRGISGRFVVCPVCGKPIAVNLLSEEESKQASMRSYGYSCCC